MVGWIMSGILTLVNKIVGNLLIWFSKELTDVFGLNDFLTFATVLGGKSYKSGGFANIQITMVWVGIVICMMIYLWQLFRCMGGAISGDVDDPILLTFKTVFAVFVIVFWMDIAIRLQSWFKAPFDALSSISTKTDASNPTPGEASQSSMNSFLSGADNLVSSASLDLFTGGILSIIVEIAIGWNYIKLLIEYVERYVVYAILTLLAPLAIATAPSHQTNDICKKFSRMYISSILMIILGALGISMANIALANCSIFENKFLQWAMITYGIIITMQKIDKYFAQSGMFTASTGGMMLDLMAITSKTLKSMGVNTTGKGLNSIRGSGPVKGGLIGGIRGAGNSAKLNRDQKALIGASPVDKMNNLKSNFDRINNGGLQGSKLMNNRSLAKIDEGLKNSFKDQIDSMPVPASLNDKDSLKNASEIAKNINDMKASGAISDTNARACAEMLDKKMANADVSSISTPDEIGKVRAQVSEITENAGIPSDNSKVVQALDDRAEVISNTRREFMNDLHTSESAAVTNGKISKEAYSKIDSQYSETKEFFNENEQSKIEQRINSIGKNVAGTNRQRKQ